MTLLAIVDEIAALLEPTPAKRDGTAAKPAEFLVGILYAWPRTERLDPEGDGSLDERNFNIRVALLVDAGFEVAAAERDRATTDAIHAKAEAFAAVFRAHRTGTSYENAQVAFDYESLTTKDGRGFYMDIAGYQLTS